MRIGWIGCGRLGFPCALACSDAGHAVYGYDCNQDLVSTYMRGELPYVEERAAELWEKFRVGSHGTGNFTFYPSIAQVVADSEIIFVAVQTPHPPELDGAVRFHHARKDFDYTYLTAALQEVAKAIARPVSLARAMSPDRRKVVVIVSTVLPGTTRTLLYPAMQAIIPKPLGEGWGLVYNPSFIAQGTTVRDYVEPEFVLVGDAPDGRAGKWAGDVAEAFYRTIHRAPVRRMNWDEAEMAKVTYNTAITTKLTIANTVAMMADALPGADAGVVMDTVKAAWRRVASSAYYSPGMGDGGSCLLPGELVLTADGPRAIETVRAGDKVLGGDGLLHPVRKVWQRLYSGPMVQLRTEGMPPARFTADHKFRVSEDGRPIYICNGSPKRESAVACADQLSALIEKPAADVALGDFIPCPDLGLVAQVPIPEWATEDYCLLAGWYLSEGSAEFNARHGRLTFSLHAREMAAAEHIKSLLLRLAPPKESGRGKGARVAITRKGENGLVVRYGARSITARLIEDFGRGAANKRLPVWAVYGDTAVAEALLKGMWQGDGHSSHFGMFYSTTSQDLAYGCMVMLARMGIISTLREIEPRVGQDGVWHRRAYEVRIRNAADYDCLAEITGLARPLQKRQKIYCRFPVVDGTAYRKVVGHEVRQHYGHVYNLWVDSPDHTFVTNVGVTPNCHPRDNIALAYHSDLLGLPYNYYDFMMGAREGHTEWLADIVEAERHDRPIVIIGQAFKPGISVTTGSPSLLLANILAERGVECLWYDHYLGLSEWPDRPCLYFLGVNDDRYQSLPYQPCSTIIDPWGMLKVAPRNCRLLRPGRKPRVLEG